MDSGSALSTSSGNSDDASAVIFFKLSTFLKRLATASASATTSGGSVLGYCTFRPEINALIAASRCKVYRYDDTGGEEIIMMTEANEKHVPLLSVLLEVQVTLHTSLYH